MNLILINPNATVRPIARRSKAMVAISWLLLNQCSDIQTCSLYNTNNYIIEYTNNQTNILFNPSISQLYALIPVQNGIYSSFCNASNTLQDHILYANAIDSKLSVIITSNTSQDMNINDKCNSDNIQLLLPQLQNIYCIYFNDIQPGIYEGILSYHDAFQYRNISDISIVNDLITATLCEYSCHISATNAPTLNPTNMPTDVPLTPTLIQ